MNKLKSLEELANHQLVAINSFVRRQTPESPFTHFDGTEEELIKMTSLAVAVGNFNPGYRDGVILVQIKPNRFYTGMIELQEGDKLVGEFKSRRKGEAPRITIRAKRDGKKKKRAKRVEIVLYRHEVLVKDGDAETDAAWEIISLNGYLTTDEVPIEPFTLMHNHFQSDGGTATNMSPEEFEKALRASFEYHKNKTLLEGA